MDSAISSHKEQEKLIFSFTIIKAFFYQNTKENKGGLGMIFRKPARPPQILQRDVMSDIFHQNHTFYQSPNLNDTNFSLVFLVVWETEKEFITIFNSRSYEDRTHGHQTISLLYLTSFRLGEFIIKNWASEKRLCFFFLLTCCVLRAWSSAHASLYKDIYFFQLLEIKFLPSTYMEVLFFSSKHVIYMARQENELASVRTKGSYHCFRQDSEPLGT